MIQKMIKKFSHNEYYPPEKKPTKLHRHKPVSPSRLVIANN